MNFEHSEKGKETRQQVGAILKSYDNGLRVDKSSSEEFRPRLIKLQKSLAEKGFFNLSSQAQERSSDESETLQAIDFEIANFSASLFMSLKVSQLLVGLVARCKTELHKPLLDELCTGSLVGAIAHHGSSELSSSTPLILKKEGTAWLLNGTMPFVSNGLFADWIAVKATADDRIGFCLLSSDASGLVVGPKLQTLGLQEIGLCSLFFQNVAVPDHQFIMAADPAQLDGWLTNSLDLAVATASVGVMKRSFEAAQKHAASHAINGKPISRHQEISFKLAEMLALLQTAELLCCRAGWLVDTGHSEADVLVRCARVFCAENGERVASEALQVMAGWGVLSGREGERGYRDAKTLALTGTTTEKARIEIADAMLKSH